MVRFFYFFVSGIRTAGAIRLRRRVRRGRRSDGGGTVDSNPSGNNMEIFLYKKHFLLLWSSTPVFSFILVMIQWAFIYHLTAKSVTDSMSHVKCPLFLLPHFLLCSKQLLLSSSSSGSSVSSHRTLWADSSTSSSSSRSSLFSCVSSIAVAKTYCKSFYHKIHPYLLYIYGGGFLSYSEQSWS